MSTQLLKCSMENCSRQAKKELLLMKPVWLPPNPQEFYDNERQWDYNFYKWEAQAEPSRNLVPRYYCPKHWAKIKWNCDRACSQAEHFNPESPCYRLRMKEFKKNQWTYTNNQIKPRIMTQQQLQTAIATDIKELKEILPINEGLLPNEDDTETWDTDACGDLLTKLDQVNTVITSENGLNNKLEEWSYRQGVAENKDI